MFRMNIYLAHSRPLTSRMSYTSSSSFNHPEHLTSIIVSLQSRVSKLIKVLVVQCLGHQRSSLKMFTFTCLEISGTKSKKREKKCINCYRKPTHSTKLSSPSGLVSSTGLRPVIISRSTTPKENTSDFSVNLPLDAYSGAM